LYDVIGEGFFGGISAKSVVDALNDWSAAGVTDLAVRINSPGGEVFQGFAIYNALTRYPGTITTHIDGAAWSIASVIAMAGKEVWMADNAQFMIHDPAALAFGGSDDLRKIADRLDATKESLITAYQRQTNTGRECLADWMTEETWFGATEAYDAGFVTHIDEALPIAAYYCPTAMKFRNMPGSVQRKVVTMPTQADAQARLVALWRTRKEIEKFRKAV
jgi:ATP-dependent Clp protease protease subunit